VTSDDEDLNIASAKSSRAGFRWYAAACVASDIGLWLISPALALLALGFEIFLVAALHTYLSVELRKAARGEQTSEPVELAISDFRNRKRL
jgi:hypothetical protein